MGNPDDAIVPACWANEAKKIGFQNIATAAKTKKKTKKSKQALVDKTSASSVNKDSNKDSNKGKDKKQQKKAPSPSSEDDSDKSSSGSSSDSDKEKIKTNIKDMVTGPSGATIEDLSRTSKSSLDSRSLLQATRRRMSQTKMRASRQLRRGWSPWRATRQPLVTSAL